MVSFECLQIEGQLVYLCLIRTAFLYGDRVIRYYIVRMFPNIKAGDVIRNYSTLSLYLGPAI